MTTISEMLGMDQKINNLVTAALLEKGISILDIKAIVKQYTETMHDDVYKTMKELEHYKYKFTELETKVDNLSTFCKAQNKGEVK